MKALQKFPLLYTPILKPVYCFAKKRKVKLYLVGGILRDLLIGRQKPSPDFDFTIRKGAISFGRALSGVLKIGFVILDKQHGACRLVGKNFTLDFTDFRGKDLKTDLLHRDFSINALALELDALFTQAKGREKLIDPYAGIRDIESRKLRIVNNQAFTEDPLRILRAFSLSCLLDFEIEKSTLELAKIKRHGLTQVSFERIRDELFKILHSRSAYKFFSLIDSLKIFEVIFPEVKKMHGVGQGPYHHLDVWEHTLETIKQLELLIKQLKGSKDIRNYLDLIISSDRKRFALLKLGALLHDMGKPAALKRIGGKLIFHGHEMIGSRISEDIGRRLKLSVGEINALRKMVFWHLRPGYLADNEILTARAKFRYFRDAGDEAVSILLLSLADQRATKGRLTTEASRKQHEKVCKALIREYFRKEKESKPQRIINGDDLIKSFKLEPSRLIGKILAEIEELQAIGKIKTKREALKAAKKIWSKQK